MSTQGLLAKGVPALQPAWLLFVKIAILVLSIIILGLAAWALSIFGGLASGLGYSGGAAGFAVFVTIWTFIVYGGTIAIEMVATHLFYRIAGVVLYSLSIIFWLTAWAYAASQASTWNSAASLFGDFGGGFDNSFKKEGSALGAVAGLGALVWILSIVHFVFFIKAALADSEGSGANNAELGQVKPAEFVQPAPVQAAYPQQQYPQQPQQPQQQYAVQQPYATQ
ncbi:hypothetical protein B0T22DRAFT_143618 [Podospora appendiculata]|uniref:MARVEL domain-containing protein n=1 Tax=Podospora appendiculata TaxID=314037 RepID=A0AAE1CC35_9PEZI|nr:hypothetical protein B0T22DRAFT_143618 [Podospora appendiculata]